MSQTLPPDREEGDGPVDEQPGHPTTTSNHPSQTESNIGDSSGLLFSVYSKAAEDEDNKMVERWQKDADGILIFTGLFSAAVAALLAVTVLDLRPSSQDISAFYLGNIYQVLADPNVTRTPTPSPVASPPSFSPPRNSVWVNSLWFLSLMMSLSCALWAISLQQWARRYLRRAQPTRCSPEKRARMRAFFAEGVEKMHISWAVEGLPILLHLSLFLFFGGVAIFLFNVNREVFAYVISWIGLFSLVYGLITVLPTIRHDSPYHSPLSTPAWFLYAGIHHLAFKILIAYHIFCGHQSWQSRGRASWESCKKLRDHYKKWMLADVEVAAEETATKRSSEIDIQILEWTLSALGDDDSLKSFFEAIPRSFNSKMLEHLKTDIPLKLRQKVEFALEAFCDRTLSSDSISDAEKVRRLDISKNAVSQISRRDIWFIFFLFRREDVPQTLEMGHTMARWFPDKDRVIPAFAQSIIAGILVKIRERNDSWVTLAARTFGLPERDLWDNIALGGDNVLLAILIHVIHQFRGSDSPDLSRILKDLLKLDIRNTHPRVQHDFCTLWNEIVQEAPDKGHHRTPVYILSEIRLIYIALHHGTDASPTAFSGSTYERDDILFQPSSYPFCNIASHRPDSTTHTSLPLPTHGDYSDASSHFPTDGGNTAPRQATQNVMEPPSSSNLTTASEIRATSRGPDVIPPTKPARFGSRSTSRTAIVAATSQDITSISTTAGPSAEPGTSQILSTISTHPCTTPAPTPTSLPNSPPESSNAGISADNPYFASPSFGSSVPVPRATGSAPLPRARARGLVNTRNISFANAVLQLLVNFPPLRNLFRELVDLKRQRGTGDPETGGRATPLVDATMEFFKEYMVEEQSQPGASRADEEKKDNSIVGSFEPTYLYDAMKEKRLLKPLFDGQQQDAEQFLSLYLDALDEELPAILPSISDHQSARAAGQAETGSQGSVMNIIESPITHIFGGKFRLPVHVPNQPYSVRTGDWRLLHLDIQPDSVLAVEDALMRVSSSQPSQDGPFGLSDASQEMLVEALPPVLILHLKRFRYDAATGGVIKIDKPVRFSSELEIPSDIMVPNTEPPSKPPHFKLYGVLYHRGESAGSGHYTVDVLHPNGDGDAGGVWLHIDDETVTRMGHEYAFGEHGEVPDERRLSSIR